MHTAVRSAGAGRGEPGRGASRERGRAEGRLLFFGICITFVPGGSCTPPGRDAPGARAGSGGASGKPASRTARTDSVPI